MDTNFRNFFTLSIILRISRKLQQVPDQIECPSCFAYSINSDIRSRDGYPIDSGIRSCGRVPDYFGGQPKADPSGTRRPLVSIYYKLRKKTSLAGSHAYNPIRDSRLDSWWDFWRSSSVSPESRIGLYARLFARLSPRLVFFTRVLLPKNLNVELAVKRKMLWKNARDADHSNFRMYKMPNYISAD